MRTDEFYRVVVAIIVWQLLAYIVIWEFDLFGMSAVLPRVLMCVWLWPWLADARHRHMHRVLGGRWSLND